MTAVRIAFALIAALALALGSWWAEGIYSECRDEGHSFAYCWQLISD